MNRVWQIVGVCMYMACLHAWRVFPDGSVRGGKEITQFHVGLQQAGRREGVVRGITLPFFL